MVAAPSKDQLVALDSMVRELALSDGWKLVVEPWLASRIDSLKDELATGLDHDKYFWGVGSVQAYKSVLQEVSRRAGRKSADIPDSE